jgi:hypothetical protein
VDAVGAEADEDDAGRGGLELDARSAAVGSLDRGLCGTVAVDRPEIPCVDSMKGLDERAGHPPVFQVDFSFRIRAGTGSGVRRLGDVW